MTMLSTGIRNDEMMASVLLKFKINLTPNKKIAFGDHLPAIFSPSARYTFLRGNKRPPRAFTLLEVLLVIIILVIISGLAIPNIAKSYKRILLKQTISSVGYLMRYAQSRAIIQNNRYRIFLDIEHRLYYLEEFSPGEEQTDSSEAFIAVSGRQGRKYDIPADITVTADPVAVEFYPNGRIDKVSWTFCVKNLCQMVSTKEQSGHVSISEASESSRGASY